MIAGLQQSYAERAEQQAVASGPSRQVQDARAAAADARDRAAQLRQQQAGRPPSAGNAASTPTVRAAPTLTAAQQAQDRALLAMEQRAKAPPVSAAVGQGPGATGSAYVYETYVEPVRLKRDSAEGMVDDLCHGELQSIAIVYDNYAKGLIAGNEAVFKAQYIGGPDSNVGGNDTRLRKALFSGEFDRVVSGAYRSKQAAVDGYFRACQQSAIARSVEAYWREYFRQQAEKHGTP